MEVIWEIPEYYFIFFNPDFTDLYEIHIQSNGTKCWIQIIIANELQMNQLTGDTTC